MILSKSILGSVKKEPIKKYAIFNPTDKHSTVTLSNSNLTAAISSTGLVRCNMSKTTEVWYAEIKINTLGNCAIGLTAVTVPRTSYPGGPGLSFGILANGNINKEGTLFFNGGALKVNDYVGITLNHGASMRISVNGADKGGWSITKGDYFFTVGSNGGSTNMTINFGETPFAYPALAQGNKGVYVLE